MFIIVIFYNNYNIVIYTTSTTDIQTHAKTKQSNTTATQHNKPDTQPNTQQHTYNQTKAKHTKPIKSKQNNENIHIQKPSVKHTHLQTHTK